MWLWLAAGALTLQRGVDGSSTGHHGSGHGNIAGRPSRYFWSWRKIGVNSNLKSELRATTEAAHEEAVRLHEVATSLENNRKSLEARISEKDEQIIDLQLAAIGAPIRVGVDLSGVVPLEPRSQPPACDYRRVFPRWRRKDAGPVRRRLHQTPGYELP